MNIGSLLTRNARYRPQHVGVVFEEQRLTFLDFNRRVNRTANALAGIGLREGDKIVTILPNCLELLEIYWATAKIGGVVVPLPPLLRGRALAKLITDSDATVVITHPECAEVLDAVKPELPLVPQDHYILTGNVGRQGYQCYSALTAAAADQEPPDLEIGPDDPYDIMYSSGTTGEPKGIIHTHYIRSMYALMFASSFRILPESVVLHAGSLVFNGSFLTLMPALYLGSTYILKCRFDAEDFIETVARERVTHVMLVPSQIVALLQSPNFSCATMGSLEMLGSVGAPLHLEHKQELQRRLPGRLYELYGLTEGVATVLDKNDACRKPNSVGSLLPLSEMKIVDQKGQTLAAGQVGEIVGRSPLLMPGYYKRPDLTAQAIVDGWLHTGDLGYVDEDGFLFLVGREKDMIVSGGVNIFPKDIEEVILQHPAVREAAVFGIPHEKWGETPVAAVILKQPGAVTPVELCDWINEHVDARNQRVHAVVIMEDFPRTTSGKTLKRVLREPYWEGRTDKI